MRIDFQSLAIETIWVLGEKVALSRAGRRIKQVREDLDTARPGVYFFAACIPAAAALSSIMSGDAISPADYAALALAAVLATRALKIAKAQDLRHRRERMDFLAG